MRIALAAVALNVALTVATAASAQAPAPPTTGAAPAQPATAPSSRLKVLVLDVKSGDLTQSERDTLTSIITTHLARYPSLDVMSGQDLRNLADVEAARQSAGCDETSCLSEIAGALGAQLIIYGQAGKLGGTLVVTLNAYDGAKQAAVARQPIEARDLSQLPALIPPAVDQLIAPVFDVNALAPRTGDSTVRSTGTTIAMGARGYDIFEARKFDICSGANKAQWFFCQRQAPVSENEFVRDYRALTGQTDLEHADVNRNTRGFVIPSLLMGIGVGGVGVSVTSLVLTYVTRTDPFIQPSPLSRSLPFGLDLGIGAALVGVGFGAWGIWELTGSLRYVDDPAEAHTISEADGRKAVERYNSALAEDINKELGVSP